MGVDITIGELIPEGIAPLFPCLSGRCAGASCRSCTRKVREEAHAEAPVMTVSTAQGMQTGGFNFSKLSYGFYARWLDETHIAAQFPMLNFIDQPSTIPIPEGLGAALHHLAVQIELGQVVTSAPVEDARFTCWFAWWCITAVMAYGDRAAILFS